LVVVLVALLLSASAAGVLARSGEAAALRARAQTAADAAALAAALEAAPLGGGHPQLAAERVAGANGARVTACRCAQGAALVEVVVELDGVAARARAMFDAERLAPAALAYDATGLHPELAAAVDRLLQAARGAVYVVSGYRSPARQAELWAGALARYGDPEAADDWVAPPGRSLHERGLAVDLGGDVELAARLVESLGLPLHRPLANEPWHFELVGARG
jgi:hypothetical protein